MKEIPIYNRVSLTINKEMLNYLTLIVEQNVGDEIELYEEEQQKIVKDLYSILITTQNK